MSGVGAHDKSRLVIASQLGEKLNGAITVRVPDVDLIELPRGIVEEVPGDAEILFAAPIHGSAARRHDRPPAAWPGRLRWIQLISAGADGYPRWFFDGPVVTCGRGPSAEPLAEFALAAIFAAAKRLPEIWIDDPARWQMTPLGTVSGATLGIVGLGAVGRALAVKALALGMRVVAIRRSELPFEIDGVARADSLAELFARSDHVVLAAPSTAETDYMVDARLLEHAKPGLHLINIARGALIDDAALIAALDDGRIGLATLDSTDPEPLPPGHAYYSHPRVRLSPHTSMATSGALELLTDKLVDNLARYRAGRPLTDIVDIARGY